MSHVTLSKDPSAALHDLVRGIKESSIRNREKMGDQSIRHKSTPRNIKDGKRFWLRPQGGSAVSNVNHIWIMLCPASFQPCMFSLPNQGVFAGMGMEWEVIRSETWKSAGELLLASSIVG
jgi:hypothetical protein